MPHAVARLRDQRLARSLKPFLARGARVERCPRCRVSRAYCVCAWQPRISSQAGVCLLMHDTEPLKPSNTGWLIADIIPDTWAFGWQRTETDPQLLALLQDPRWQPLVVFPGEYAAPERVISHVSLPSGKRPLFILLDATWTEARKIFRKSPYLDGFPVLSIQPEQLSRYRLRRSTREEHLCTAEVAALCLELAQEPETAHALNLWLDAFTQHYLASKQHQRVDTCAPLYHQLSQYQSLQPADTAEAL